MARFRNRLVAVVAISLFLLSTVGCVGLAPLDDYNLAYSAIESARVAQAPRFAPGYFSQAEEYYRQALMEYENRNYGKAQEKFQQARKSAERAENYTALKRANSGDGE